MNEGSRARSGALLVALVAILGVAAVALVLRDPGSGPRDLPGWADDPPMLEPLVQFARSESEMRVVLPAYTSGRQAMLRSVQGLDAATAEARQLAWYRAWLDELASLDFHALSIEGQVDHIGLRNRIEFEIAMVEAGQEVVGGGEGPIGEDGLRAHLQREMIPYTAEELIAIGEREYAWMLEAMKDASRRLGYGDDWHAAQEAVKQAYVPPGEKAALIRDLAYESEAFLEVRGDITLPPLMRETWRMGMRGLQGQLTNPFFTGGEQITISYPTYDMTHDFKLMSARGNNPHFNRATVHHELIPGHGHQGWMTSRFNTHRGLFNTPFWGEGWALYWEFILWDQGFPRDAMDEIGMLTWRMHRAARIVFSMSYHLGRMTEQEAVDYLVENVGFERSNSEAEVRRSVGATPLYQIAYMIGGLQLYSLYDEMVTSGRMASREFHDSILQGGRMPIEMVRLRMTGEGLTPDYRTQWRFYGDPLDTTVTTASGTPAAATPAADTPTAVPTAGLARTAVAATAPARTRAFDGGAEGQAAEPTPGDGAPNLVQLIASGADDSDFRVALRRFEQDRALLARRYDVPLSPVLIERQRTFLNGWMARLDAFDAAGLNAAGQEEVSGLRTEIEEGLAELLEQEARVAAMAPLIAFARPIQMLQERRRDRHDVESFEAAQTIEDARKEVLRLTALLGDEGGAANLPGITAEVAEDAGVQLRTLQTVLTNWYAFYYGFDPVFTWWVQTPYREFTEALADYRAAIDRTWPTGR